VKVYQSASSQKDLLLTLKETRSPADDVEDDVDRLSGRVSFKVNGESFCELAHWYTFTVLNVDKELFQGGKCSIVDVINKSTTYLPTQVAVPGKREELEEFLKQLLDASHWQKAIALLKEATTYKALRLASHLEVIPASFHRHIHTQTQRNDSNSSSEGVDIAIGEGIVIGDVSLFMSRQDLSRVSADV
jgi:hypothetical protein